MFANIIPVICFQMIVKKVWLNLGDIPPPVRANIKYGPVARKKIYAIKNCLPLLLSGIFFPAHSHSISQ